MKAIHETCKSANLEYYTWHFMDMYVVRCKQIRMQMTWVGLSVSVSLISLCQKNERFDLIMKGRHETCKSVYL